MKVKAILKRLNVNCSIDDKYAKISVIYFQELQTKLKLRNMSYKSGELAIKALHKEMDDWLLTIKIEGGYKWMRGRLSTPYFDRMMRRASK